MLKDRSAAMLLHGTLRHASAMMTVLETAVLQQTKSQPDEELHTDHQHLTGMYAVKFLLVCPQTKKCSRK